MGPHALPRLGAGPVARPAARRRTVLRLWLPLTPLFLILAPFALLLAALAWPFAGLAPAPYRVNPIAAAFGLGRLLLSLGGTVVDVDARDALVRLRIF